MKYFAKIKHFKMGFIIVISVLVVIFISGCGKNYNLTIYKIKEYSNQDEIKQSYSNNIDLLNKVSKVLSKKKDFFDYLDDTRDQRAIFNSNNIKKDEIEKYFLEDEWKAVEDVFKLTGPYDISYNYYIEENLQTIQFVYMGIAKEGFTKVYDYYYFSKPPSEDIIKRYEKLIEFHVPPNYQLEKINENWFFSESKYEIDNP